MTAKVNQLERTSGRQNIFITGIPETYAKRMTEDGDDDVQPHSSHEDTVKAVCDVIREACCIAVKPDDLTIRFDLNPNTMDLD